MLREALGWALLVMLILVVAVFVPVYLVFRIVDAKRRQQ